MALLIGDIKIDNPFLLAPLAGITDKSFRRLCLEKGAALVYSEMVSAKALWYKDKKTEKLLEIGEGGKPIAFQLFGSEPEIMAHAVNVLKERENVLIDINMGCPVPKVVKNGEGSALLKNPDLACKIVEAMKAVSSKPITAKIRAGWDSKSINAVEMSRVLESAGVDAICIHGRTREQYYSGKSDWEIIRKAKEAINIPMIGNGDIKTGCDAVAMLEQTGCDAVMIARGAMGNPWIFEEALCAYEKRDFTGPSLKDKADMFLRHAELTKEDKGEYTAVLEMRKHVGWYFKGEKHINQLKNAVNAIKEFDRVVDEIKKYAFL